MRRRTFLLIAGFGVVAFVLSILGLRSGDLGENNPPSQIVPEVRTDNRPSKESQLSNSNLRQGFNTLTAEEKTLFNSEIDALTSLFQKWEKEFTTIMFEGKRKEIYMRNIRINSPDRERLDQMANAYSAVLRKYPKDSQLHTALWTRINELMSDYSRERMIFFTHFEGKPWSLKNEVRDLSSERDSGAVTTGIPDENGRLSFVGRHKTTLFDAAENPKTPTSGTASRPKGLDRYRHLLDP